MVLCTLVMLVAPIPTELLDSAIAVNLCASVLVLLTAFFLPEPVRLPSFPTIILVTTLFRLSINVSSTRLILRDADAGEIIHTFGSFAAGGSIVVGAVVFVVLTIVQFVVIAKGSERVAEVAARFTLDAMQGRQLSIDADLSGGRISPDQAKRRRTLLDRESKLYGAMDGAMKFVKGDAIAGIIISVINVVAGLIIGVMSRGMTVGEAAEVYTVLTVGDGLVSQIPSLLICVAAGLVVTRVASGTDESSNAASDMAEQLAQLPGALLGAAGVMFLVGATSGLTGFPPIQFFVLGGLLAALGVPLLLRQRAQAKRADTDDDSHGKDATVRGIELDLVTTDRIAVRIGGSLFGGSSTETEASLTSELQRTVAAASRDRGVPMPQAVVRSDERFADGYAIYLHTRLCARAPLAGGEVIALCSEEQARAAGASATKPFNVQWDHPEACRVRAADQARLEAKKIRVLRPAQAIAEHLRAVLTANAAEFLALQDVFNLLEAIKRTHPDLVTQLQSGSGRSGSAFGTTHIAEILRQLADELIPLRDLPLILSSLSRFSNQASTADLLSEALRPYVRPLIVASAESAPGVISTVELTSGVASRLADVDSLADFTVINRFRDQWLKEGLGTGRLPKPVAIYVPLNLDSTRLKVRRALRLLLPTVPVITLADIPSGVELETVAVISELAD
jgi:type III secretion protein V